MRPTIADACGQETPGPYVINASNNTVIMKSVGNMFLNHDDIRILAFE